MTIAERHTDHIGWARDDRIVASPVGNERPSDYASLDAERVDLDNVINELLLRLEDHKYRWEVYEYALTDAVERRRVRAIIDHLQAAVHTGGPAVLGPLGHALFTARLDGWTLRGFAGQR